ncbi:MAG: hypothetical protein ACFCUI_10810 [Bernardetiaceae bacterium]
MKKFLFICLLAFGLTSLANASTPNADAVFAKEIVVEETVVTPAPPPELVLTIYYSDGTIAVYVWENGEWVFVFYG